MAFQTMTTIQLLSSLLFFITFSPRVSSEVEHASNPPRGWNSYDSFSWIISEEEFLRNAEIVSKLLRPHGYEYVVLDYLWYRRKVPGAAHDSLGFDVIDEWGRLMPDPGRWPSSEGGKGFTEVANRVHNMDLKFGIHVMRGLSRQAYDANTPILDTTTGVAYEESGRQWRARDIGIPKRACAWMPHGFMSVNTKLGAGRAFLRSLYEQYADWGVDFVKHDCVFGDDLDIDEITLVSEVLEKLDHPILYSISPGTSVTPTMAKDVSKLVNMYRITGDDWDTWGDVAAHFDGTRDFSAADLIGSEGLLGKSWPDLDMLPLGWLTDPGCNQGPHRKTNLNQDEQRTQMTLWAMSKSPLMFGGDVRSLDKTTYDLITNPTLLEINSFSSNNKEFPYVTGKMGSTSKTARLSIRSLVEMGTSKSHVLGLISCKDPNATGWSVEAIEQDLDRICWKKSLGSHDPFCLYKRTRLFASGKEGTYEQGMHLLYASDGMEFCLDSSSRQKRTSKDFKGGLFSPCRWDANQVWELSDDGALISNYSGLCARMDSVEASDPSGVRSWIATGREGEIYLAFFNLNWKRTTVTAKLSDITRGVIMKGRASCKCREVWSRKEFGEIEESISIPLETHGCALFVLNCSN